MSLSSNNIKHKVGDVVRITVSGEQATNGGSKHPFPVGELVKIKRVDGITYKAEYLDGRDWWNIDDNCCEAIKPKDTLSSIPSNFTTEDKLKAMREIFDRCLEIAEAKSHDYAGVTDSLSNFRTFGWKGVVVRLGDKFNRIANFSKQGEMKVKDESVEDTLKDMINYASICLMLYRQENANQNPSTP